VITVKEKSPSGKNSFVAVSKWLNDNTYKMATDTPALWAQLKPEIKQAMAYTFSDANPAGWPGLKPSYVRWKAKFGFPGTIGVMTGALKESVTNQAKVSESSKYLNWALGSVTNEFGENTKIYGPKFNERRPIFKYARKFLKGIFRKVLKDFVTKGHK